MGTNRGSPGYRGKRTGPDAVIGRQEQDALRQQIGGDIRGFMYGSGVAGFTDSNASSAIALNSLYLAPLFPPIVSTKIKHVRFAMAAGAAGRTLETVLYVVDIRTKIASILPGSRITISIPAAASYSGELEREVIVTPGLNKIYYQGVRVTGATTNMRVRSVQPAFTKVLTWGATEALPNQFNIATIVTTTSSTVPAVYYLSQEINDII